LPFTVTIFLVPKKVVKQRKDGHVHAKDQDGSMLLLDMIKTKGSASSSQILSNQNTQLKPTDDSDTEDEEADAKSPSKPASNLPNEPLRSPSPAVDPGRAPGRIIGTTYPLADFKKNLAQGDVVTKAVEDLAWVIKDIVMKPFSSRRTEELLECMRVLRDTSLKVIWQRLDFLCLH
jgi:ATP-dependent DNA helicase 2 subunit 2